MAGHLPDRRGHSGGFAVRRAPILATALLAIWLACEGDIQLAVALRSLGEVSLRAALHHPPLWMAVLLLSGHFFLWLSVLARAELSVVVPYTACYYVFNGLLVQLRMGEKVSATTWMGTFMIAAGVYFVQRSVQPELESKKSKVESFN